MTEQPNSVRRTSPSRTDGDVGSSGHAGTPGPIERQQLADGFGARLRQLRRRAGLTQRQVAERAGRTPEFVSLLERGLRRPESLTVLLLSRVLASTRAEQKAVRVELRRLAGDSMRQWRRRDGRDFMASMEVELPATMAKVNRQLRAAGLDELPPLPGTHGC
jgi:transcriptional regulator with XRE-family HTH domain